MKVEAGTLIKGAYAVINGVEHEVHMPEYEGDTPVSPENLNKMQEDIVKGTTIYENSSGASSGTIQLSSSIDTKKIGIVFEEENGVEGFREVENPIRKNCQFTN